MRYTAVSVVTTVAIAAALAAVGSHMVAGSSPPRAALCS